MLQRLENDVLPLTLTLTRRSIFHLIKNFGEYCVPIEFDVFSHVTPDVTPRELELWLKIVNFVKKKGPPISGITLGGG